MLPHSVCLSFVGVETQNFVGDVEDLFVVNAAGVAVLESVLVEIVAFVVLDIGGRSCLSADVA